MLTEPYFLETVYRRFGKGDQVEEDSYYGENDANKASFERLPENVFVKILQFLPWPQQLLCRRVSRRWITASNMALAASVKSISSTSDPFCLMNSKELERLILIVADGLESLAIEDFLHDVDLVFCHSVTSFRSLKTVDFGRSPLRYDDFFHLLDMCPRLTKLAAMIPKKPSDVTGSLPKTYESVQHLRLLSQFHATITDPHLMAITEYFPNVSRLEMNGNAGGYFTESGLSAFVEKYADKLRHLEIKGPEMNDDGDNQDFPRFGVFTGIGACCNLTHLVMSRNHCVTDDTLMALSNGCSNLETLEVEETKGISVDGLSALAKLPKLKKLNLSFLEFDVSGAVTAIATNGMCMVFWKFLCG